MDMLTSAIIAIPMGIAAVVGFIFMFFLWPVWMPIAVLIVAVFLILVFTVGRRAHNAGRS